jgi:phytoene dehydrogenase-like protein
MITIIGGGFSGIAAAYFLHRAGKDVTLFERSRGLGGRATTHNLAYRTIDIRPNQPFVPSVAVMKEAAKVG